MVSSASAQKRILLGITGSIAAYKSIQILRDLTAGGIVVEVVLTAAARRFVPALTLEVLSGRPVLSHLFDPHHSVRHLELAESSHVILIAPATADFLAKMAMGLADDLLGNILLASRVPVIIAPAMDGGMWEHAAVQQNVEILRGRGIHIIAPTVGPLASGTIGIGRLAETSVIVQAALNALCASNRLKNKTVLVTAGPTQEPLDPIRFLSNRSSGKMGYAMAEAARDLGARVILISGPTERATPFGVEHCHVRTAAQMKEAVHRYFREADLLAMAAAVSDYRPRFQTPQKIKKSGQPYTLLLEETEDILAGLPEFRGGKIIVGFAAETENVIEQARMKLHRKNLDIIVANNVTEEGAGFDVDTNIACLLDRTGRVLPLPRMSKRDLAMRIFEEAIRLASQATDPGEMAPVAQVDRAAVS